MYWEKVKFILVEESEIKGSKVDMFHSKGTWGLLAFMQV